MSIIFGNDHIVHILEALEKLSSTNDKIDLLRDNKENEALQAYLDVALNLYRVYHIKKLPKKSQGGINIATIENIYSLGGLAKYLESKKGLTNRDLDVVYHYLEDFDNSPLLKKWAEKAILKKPIAGLGVKTVNKAFGCKFLPEYSVMLMEEWKKSLEELRYPLYVQRKLDGFRLTCIPKHGYIGRSGRPIANISISEHFEVDSKLKGDFVLDGEVYSHKRNFNEIASILSSEDKLIPDDIKHIIFNVIPIKEWEEHNCLDTYTEQLTMLMLVGSTKSKNVGVIDTYACQNAKDLKELYESFLTEGYEGVIIRGIQSKYQRKRVRANTQDILKLKPHDFIDARITGVFEGEGKMVGMLGGFNIELEDGVQLKVGSGFKEKERIELWKNRDVLKGRWLRLKYTEKTPDKKLRFPIFGSLRDDKN